MLGVELPNQNQSDKHQYQQPRATKEALLKLLYQSTVAMVTC